MRLFRLAPLSIVSALSLGSLVGTPACSEQAPREAPKQRFNEYKSDVAPEPELTLDEQRKKLEEERANQPEPKLDPNDPREKWELVWKNGKSALKSLYTERENLITQMRALAFDEKMEDQKKRYRALVDAFEGYAIGEKPEELETAGPRFCKVIDDLMAGTEALKAEGDAKLKEVDTALAELEAKQKDGGKVATRQYEKLEADRKLWSAQVLGVGYIHLGMRTLFDEALIFVENGARRGQVALRDCLGKADAKVMPNELAEAVRQQVIKRSRYYLP